MTWDEFREVLDDVGETPCMAWPDAFFLDEDSSAGTSGEYRQARALCRTCPIRLECLDYAISNDERFGVWGGLTPKERGGIDLKCI